MTIGTAGAGVAGGFDRSVPPELGSPPSLELPVAEEIELDNGLRVLLVERSALPIVNVEILIGGGASAHEPARAGLAALTSDMLDEGSGSLTALDIAEGFEHLGARFTTTAGYDASAVRLNVLSGRLAAALDLMADVVLRPSFPIDDFVRVKRERSIRIQQGFDSPARLADNALADVLYGAGDPYGRPLLGTLESLEVLGRDDVIGFYESTYHAANATLIVVGDVDVEALRSLVSERFGTWRSGSRPEIHAGAALQTPPGTPIYLVDKPGAAQSEIRVGRVSASRMTNDYFSLTVLNTVLGGAFTSRLNQRLREEKGHTYGARSEFTMRSRPSPFIARAAVHTPVTDSAVSEFANEITRLSVEAIPVNELERARNYVALRLAERFETGQDVASRLSEIVEHGLPTDFYDSFVEGIQDVSIDDAAAAARDYLALDGMVIVVAGDRALVEEPLRRIGVSNSTPARLAALSSSFPEPRANRLAVDSIRGARAGQRPESRPLTRARRSRSRGQPLVRRGLSEREGREDGLRPPLRAHDVPGLGACPEEPPLRARRTSRRISQRLDVVRPHELLRDRAVPPPRDGALARIRTAWAGCFRQ